jgi:glycosyltransferase involved in cell wall biosynthesis
VRLAFVIYGTLDRLSGGYLYDRKLAERLVARGHEVHVVSQDDSSLYSRLRGNGRDLIRRISAVNPHLVLADELNHASLFLAVPALQRRGYPVAAVVHHLRSREKLPGRRLFIAAVEREFLRRADALVCNSPDTLESVQRLIGYRPERVVVATPAADNPLLPPRRAGNIMKVLFVGSLIPRKGLHRLITSIADLPGGAWELHVCGDESTDPGYTRLCRSLAGNSTAPHSIIFHGRLDEKDLEQLRARCDVLAVPSDLEGFGIVYLEAMRAGMVPVAARTGGAGSLINDRVNGLLVDPVDDRSLRSALEYLAADPVRRSQLAAAARKTAEQFPDWETSMNLAVDFLEGLAR